MNAIILYDEIGLAKDAKAMLESARRHGDEGTQWNVKPWRVDMLIAPQAAAEVLAEAAEAHLIVFALGQPQAFPQWMLTWLDDWSMRRQVQEAALAVWEADDGTPFPAQTLFELSRFARRHGLSLIVNEGNPSEVSSAALDRKEERNPVHVAGIGAGRQQTWPETAGEP